MRGSLRLPLNFRCLGRYSSFHFLLFLSTVNSSQGMFLKERKRSSLTTVITFKPVRIFAARATNSFDHVDFFCGINSIVQTGLSLFQRPEFFAWKLYIFSNAPKTWQILRLCFSLKVSRPVCSLKCLLSTPISLRGFFAFINVLTLGKDT